MNKEWMEWKPVPKVIQELNEGMIDKHRCN